MSTQLRIVTVKPLHDFMVQVKLTDGTIRDLDLRPALRGPVFQNLLRSPEAFREVRVEHGTLAWPDDIDLDPDVLLGNDVAIRTRAAERVATRFKEAMPCICQFDGASIYVYYNDHVPPHIHVKKGGLDAEVEIITGDVLEGSIEKNLHNTVRKWVVKERGPLLEAYAKAQAGIPPGKVNPP